MKNPFLTGETIYLRTIEEADLNANYREWFNDEEVCRYNSHHRFPNYDENMRDYYENVIKSHGNLILAICDKEADTHVGNIALEICRIRHSNRQQSTLGEGGGQGGRETYHRTRVQGVESAPSLLRCDGR